MNIFISLIIAFMSVFSVSFPSKNDEKIDLYGDLFTYNDYLDGVVITGLKDTETAEITVPDKISGKTVLAISEHAFSDNATITSVTLPETIIEIGYAAFSGCTALKYIRIPFTGNSPKNLSDRRLYPFGYIFGEESYPHSEKITQYYRMDSYDEVESSDYYIPKSLAEVEIFGKTSHCIPREAFYNCSSLKKITIGSNVTEIGEYAFSGCVADIVWQDPEITVIGEHAFSDFKGKALTIPSSAKHIGRGAYDGCVEVENFTIPDSVKDIGIFAFSYCYKLKSVTLGKNVNKIGLCAFYFCYSLTDVVLSENLEEIEENAFDSCRALERITFPSNLKRIRPNVFNKCSKLKSVEFASYDWVVFNSVTSGITLDKSELKDSASAAKLLKNKFYDYIWETAGTRY